MSTTTIKSILADIKRTAQELNTLNIKSFEGKADKERELGMQFKLLVTTEGKDATPNGVYDKYATQLKPIIGKTIMVNECYEFAMLSTAEFAKVLKAYKAKGIKDELNADGTPKLHTEKLGRAVKAYRDKRYNLQTGALKARPNGGGGKTKKAKADVQREKVVEFVASIGIEDDHDWDFRYVPTDELKAMRAAIDAELKARELGAKVLS